MIWKSKYQRREWLLRNERRIDTVQTVVLAIAAVAVVAFIALNINR